MESILLFKNKVANYDAEEIITKEQFNSGFKEDVKKTTAFWNKLSEISIKSGVLEKKIDILLQPYNKSILSRQYMEFGKDDEHDHTFDVFNNAKNNWK